MGTFFGGIRRQLVDLNLFQSGLNEAKIVREERWSTRLYLILLCLGLAILILYTALGVRTIHVVVKEPSLETFETLQLKYLETLECPCSQIAVKYGHFVQIEPIYHQICTSSFVTQEWIDASYAADASTVWPMDVRTVISAHAQLIRSFCINAQRAISYALIDTLSSSLISAKAMSSSLVQLQINIQKEALQSTSKWQLAVTINFLELISSSSHLISGLGTNSFIYMTSNESSTANVRINGYQQDSNSTPCYCLSINKCAMPGALYSSPLIPTFGLYNLEIFANQTIPIKGIQVGCLAMDGLFASTLECYYDPTCLELLVSNSKFFSPLSSTLSSRFPQNLAFEKIVNELMVEEWSSNQSFLDYYSECAPTICSYSYNQRNDFVIILTTIFALIGGLSTVLRLVIPFMVKFLIEIREKIRLRNAIVQPATIVWIEQRSMLSNHLIIYLDNAKDKLVLLWFKIKTLNLFDSNSDDISTQHYEQKTTRLYILLIIITFVVLVGYTVTTEETKIYTIENPSQQIYEQFYAEHADTMTCTCTKIAIEYSKFISIEADYHQICTSSFISPLFFTQLGGMRKDISFYRGDFMLMSVEYFQWLITFCVLSQQTISNQLIEFQVKLFVNDKLLDRHAFDVQSTELADYFISNVQYIFARGIKELREMMGFAQPLSATSIITYQFQITTTSSDSQVQVEPVDFFLGCCCLCDPTTCSNDAAFYDYNSRNNSFDSVFKVEGVRIACSPMESLLQSNLACWYSSDCYQTVINYWKNRTNDLSEIPSILNKHVSSRFNYSTLLSLMIEQLMVENWSKEIFYNLYFNECAPQYCTYSITQRRDVVFLVTILLGLFGGLNVALKLLTPLFVQLVSWFITHGRRSLDSLHRNFREFPSRFVRLNLFYHRYLSSELTIQEERHSTRLYFILLTIGMLILLFYYSLIQSIITVSIENPTEEIYENLRQSKSISSLQYPCTYVSISYGKFVEVNTSLHEICSSSFIEQDWIKSIFGNGDWSNLSLNDFHGRGVVYFQGLYSLCFIYRENLIRYVSHFLLSSLINVQILTKDQLISQVDDTITQVQAISRADHSSLYKCARDLINDNQLMSIYSTNWIYSSIKYDSDLVGLPIPLKAVLHGNCSCSRSSTCLEPVKQNGEIVPGFVVGCLPMESIFQSTLVCLYNQTCIDQINMNSLSVLPLIARSISKYPIDRTIEQLIDTAFDEEWSVNINYSIFFNECQPANCFYSTSHRREPVQIIITLLGLYGGLTVALRFIVPYIIAFVHRIILKFRELKNNVHPQNQQRY